MKLFVGGADGSGKTSLAEAIAKKVDCPVFNFGTALRKEIWLQYGVSLEALSKKPTPESIRGLLRQHGAQRRQENPDYWVNKVQESLKRLDKWTIGDGRYENEANMAKSQGAFLVYLDTPYDPNLDQSFSQLHLVKAMSHLVLRSKSCSIDKMANFVVYCDPIKQIMKQ